MAATLPSRAPRLSDADRRRQLLDFGRRHFAEHAFDALPMHAIAKHAGVSTGLLYHHFGGRRGFYVATVEDVIDGVLAAMAVDPDAVPDAAVQELIAGFVGFVEANAAIYQALVRGGLGADPEVAAQLDRVRQYATRTLSQRFAVELGPLQRVQFAGWIAWVESATSAWLDEPAVDTESFVQTVVQTLLAGVASVFVESAR